MKRFIDKGNRLWNGGCSDLETTSSKPIRPYPVWRNRCVNKLVRPAGMHDLQMCGYEKLPGQICPTGALLTFGEEGSSPISTKFKEKVIDEEFIALDAQR